MGYSVEQMMQGFVDNRGINIIKPSVSNKVLCNDGTSDISNGKNPPCLNKGGQKQINPIEGGQAFLDRQIELARQQAVMQEMGAYNNRLTDKVFGKEGGWSFERPMRIGAYIIIGAVVGRYVAKNMGKSTTLGMVVGGLAPLLAFKLTIEYDKKNTPKQEPRQKVAIEPTPTPMPNKPKPLGNIMPLDLSSQELNKTPNEFTIKSNGFNTRYYKDVKTGMFSFIAPDLYKQPYSTTGMSGVMPTKITSAEFLNAYNEFLKQPK
jgi:hypothetical protein